MTSVMTQTVARLLLAPILVLAAAMVVKGYSAVGDGFAAGLIASLGVLIQYLAFGARDTEQRLPIRRAPQVAVVGLVMVLAVALHSLLRGDALLTHWPPADEEPTRLGTIELTSAFAFDVGIFLLVAGGTLTALHALARLTEEEDDP